MDLVTLGRFTLAAYMCVLALLCLYGLHRYALVALYFRVRKRAPQAAPPAGGDWPSVTVQLPMYNERWVARRIIESAAAIDYPAERLEIQVLDDSTDETRQIARETVERLAAAGVNIVYQRRADRTGYKAGALEAGLRAARGELIAIFDADFVPPRNILRATVGYFADPRVGMVQTRWDHLNREASLLTKAQAVLLDGHFVIEHTARNRSGRFMSFNGTAGIWRREAIADAGGWQHDTLTEDLDLSYRAQLRGWKFVFLPDLTSPAELPPEMNAFKSQQHRWTKGGAQTCVKLLPQVLRSGLDWRVKLEAFFHLTSCVVYILMVLLSVLIGPALIAKLIVRPAASPWQPTIDTLLFVIGTGSALAFYSVSQVHLSRDWRQALVTIPSMMSIGIGIAFNNAVAAIEGFCCKAGEFVRTPKYGDGRAASHAAGGADAQASRRLRGNWKAWVELGLAGYLTACLGVFFLFDDWGERIGSAIPFLGLFIFGYAYVGVQSLRAGRLAGRE